MQNSGKSLIQAIEAQSGRVKVSSGDFVGVQAFCCHEDGSLVLKFAEGDETISFSAGESMALAYIDITISSGVFTVN